METNDKMPFDFGESPKDKSKNIIKVIGVGGGGSNAVNNQNQIQKLHRFIKKLD